MFLQFIWCLRRAANLPTLYMDSASVAIVWKDGQQYHADWASLIAPERDDLIPKATWCLIDSNIELEAIPDQFIDFGRFLIQAASPRPIRFKWRSKMPTVDYFVMKDWSCEELIAGRQLQRLEGQQNVSEQALLNFHRQYGGSARNAYNYATRTQKFEKLLNEAAIHISEKSVVLACSSAEPTIIEKLGAAENQDIQGAESIAHRLLTVFPISDENRKQFRINPPTDHTMQKVLRRFHWDHGIAASRLYRWLAPVSRPGPKALAEDLYATYCHGLLAKGGGSWSLFDEKPLPAEEEEQVTGRWFTVSCKLLIAHNRSIKIVHSPMPRLSLPMGILRRSTSNQKIETHIFDSDLAPSEIRVGVYYQPRTRNFPTFDSFFVGEPHHAIVFRATIWDSPTVKECDVNWLKERNIINITYIYVSPSATSQAMVCSDSFDAIYHLHLDFPKEGIMQPMKDLWGRIWKMERGYDD
ncbi:hypothetical protein GYMLUDRAFT_382066 [Collybiopsis luxurians FD-317 M1]|nr:hypothetical protein GYMLUDRAFT_382066 [Collybiopsis luxurians FD-317 M1]